MDFDVQKIIWILCISFAVTSYPRVHRKFVFILHSGQISASRISRNTFVSKWRTTKYFLEFWSLYKNLKNINESLYARGSDVMFQFIKTRFINLRSKSAHETNLSELIAHSNCSVNTFSTSELTYCSKKNVPRISFLNTYFFHELDIDFSSKSLRSFQTTTYRASNIQWSDFRSGVQTWSFFFYFFKSIIIRIIIIDDTFELIEYHSQSTRQ